MAENLLEIKNLKKYFSTPHGELHAVDNVTLNIEKGKTIGVVGESGCGKSTLGKTLMRLYTPTAGEILYNGKDIASMPIREFKKNYRTNIQMIFQDPYASLDPRMNVLQLIEEPIKVNNKKMPKKEVEERAKEMMELVGLAKRLENTYPHELDGGRRQRIGIARALSLCGKVREIKKTLKKRVKTRFDAFFGRYILVHKYVIVYSCKNIVHLIEYIQALFEKR